MWFKLLSQPLLLLVLQPHFSHHTAPVYLENKKAGAFSLFKWLKDYQRLEEEITYLEFKLEQTEIELKRWVEGDLVHVKLQHDSLGAQVEDNIEKIKKDLDFKRDQKEKLVNFIGKFKGVENKLLKLKYVDGMTLEKVAEHLDFSDSYIRQKHAELVKRIKFTEKLGGS